MMSNSVVYQRASAGEDVEAQAIEIPTQVLIPSDDVKEVELADVSPANLEMYQATSPENAPTVLTFNDLVVTVKNKDKKVLIDHVSGSITGGFWAIMGASGSGKTTLLSTLSLRLDTKYMNIEGEFRLNGKQYSRALLKAMSAYVMQDDVLHAELTAEETLLYAARLRMSSEHSLEDRKARVAEVLSLMGITHCKDVIIGNTRRKGVSGGERKRVSIAMELLTRPQLLFLDEPTTGLDSSTSLSICRSLKELSDRGECTVVCTIHQPQPKIFNLFDNLILMKLGTILYQGRADKVEQYLSENGKICPRNASIADFMLDVVSPKRGLAAANEDVDDFGKKYIVPVNLELGLEKPLYTKEGARSWLEQYSILVHRNIKQYFRNYDIIMINITATVIMAVFVGRGLWYHIGTGQKSIPKRVPSLFFTVIAQGFINSIQSVNSFPWERAVMLRERQAGSYKVSSYFLAKTTVDVLTQIWPSVIYGCIVYWMIGYQPIASKFVIYVAMLCMVGISAASLATAVCCCCVSVELTTVVLSFCFEISRLYSGYFASPVQMDTIPNWKFLDAISYIRYGYFVIAINELTGLDIECDTAKKCAITSGEQVMAQYGYDKFTMESCVGYLFLLNFAFRVIAYLGLRFIKS